MKRITSIILAFVLCLSLCACTESIDNEVTKGTDAYTTTGFAVTTDSATEAAAEPTDEVTTEGTAEVTTEAATEAAHIHSFTAATCSEPETCTECGATNGSAAGHSYSNGICTACGVSDPNSTSQMVWIPTKGGKKYHSHASYSNMDDPEYVTLSEAEQRGFTACKKCYN